MTGPLEAFVTEYERREVGVNLEVGEPSGKKVAIVGAGPAGLSCAEQLIKKGHAVTIFDSKPAPGGLLTYGIPNFKLPKELVFCWCNDLEEAGVEIVTETYIGRDKSLDDLLTDGYQAAFVGVGVGVDAPMELPDLFVHGCAPSQKNVTECAWHRVEGHFPLASI